MAYYLATFPPGTFRPNEIVAHISATLLPNIASHYGSWRDPRSCLMKYVMTEIVSAMGSVTYDLACLTLGVIYLNNLGFGLFSLANKVDD